jgi:hypothetical protein
MGKREDLIKNLELAITYAKTQDDVCWEMPGLSIEVHFNDEQQKIMSADDYWNKTEEAHHNIWLPKEGVTKSFKAGWGERGKCFQPLVDELEKLTKSDNDLLSNGATHYLNLIIKET